jgi:Fis family transcriptional regulator
MDFFHQTASKIFSNESEVLHMMNFNPFLMNQDEPHSADDLQKAQRLRELVGKCVNAYLHKCNNQALQKGDVYKRFLRETEEGIFEAVLNYTEGNESRTSRILGISRGTLRQRRKLFGHYQKK